MTPNQISLSSVVFAVLAALCFWQVRAAPGAGGWLLLAGLFIQLRLLCNLLDGMVAVEGGKHSKAGELFNDLPDRVADALILLGAGYACPVAWQAELGWSAAWLAAMTAYVRTLNVSVGAPVDFRGPMAKPQRMAVLTLACVLGWLESLWLGSAQYSLLTALVLIIAGSVLTLVRRTRAAYQFLEQR
ncbi:MAG: CDP-alcohol phosphatidyltransferase family protein [Thiolinea sp.]